MLSRQILTVDAYKNNTHKKREWNDKIEIHTSHMMMNVKSVRCKMLVKIVEEEIRLPCVINFVYVSLCVCLCSLCTNEKCCVPNEFFSNQYSFITRNTLSLLNIYHLIFPKIPNKMYFLVDIRIGILDSAFWKSAFKHTKSLFGWLFVAEAAVNVSFRLNFCFFVRAFLAVSLCINHSWLSARKQEQQFVDAHKWAFLCL